MNAPHLHSKATSATMENPGKAFLEKLSIEITPKQIEKLPVLAANLAKGTNVFIALIDPAEVDAQIHACVALRGAGFEPIPHVPARFVRDEEDLKSRIGAFADKAKVSTILCLGGGAPQPVGRYEAAIQLMETGVFEAYGLKRIGIAGHPEGNPDITKIHGEAALLAALKLKQAWLKEKNLSGFIARNFCLMLGHLPYGPGNCVSKALICRCMWVCRGRPR
jgi:methylenetetrahydrofolate reductase (NADPH)